MSIQEKFNRANVVYKITKDIDLGGKTLTIPEGCTLDFQGGSFSNGTILGISYKQINGNYNFIKNGCYLSSNEIDADWIFENTDDCNTEVLKQYTDAGSVIHFSSKTYVFNTPIVIQNANNGVARFYGVKNKTILKFPLSDGIVFKNTNWWNKYHTVKDLNIYSYGDCIILRPYIDGDMNSYCVKDSLFKNLSLTSETGYCIYNCLIKQGETDISLPHNNIFRNIRFNRTEGNINAFVYGVIGLNNIFDDVTDSYTNPNGVYLRTMFQNCIARFTNINVTYRGYYRQFIYNSQMSSNETTRERDNISFDYGESNPIEIDNCNLESFVFPIIVEDILRVSLNDVQTPHWIKAQDVYYMFETKKFKYIKISNVEFTGSNEPFTGYMVKVNGDFSSFKEAFHDTVCESNGVTAYYSGSVYFFPKFEGIRAWHTTINYKVAKDNGYNKYLSFDVENSYKSNIGDFEHINCRTRSASKHVITDEASLTGKKGSMFLKITSNTEVTSISHYDPFGNPEMNSDCGIDNDVLHIEVQSAGKVTLIDSPTIQGGFILPNSSIPLSYGTYVFHKVYANNEGKYNWKLMLGYHVAGSSAPIVRDVLTSPPPYINPSYKDSFIGIMKFSSVLGKPIWYNGTKWVDATGAEV